MFSCIQFVSIVWAFQLAQAIQITQPPAKQNSLSMTPDPRLGWVYTNNDPPSVDIEVLQIPDQPISGSNSTMAHYMILHHQPTAAFYVMLPLRENNFQKSMKVNITIKNSEDSNQTVLATAGPFDLHEYAAGYDPPASLRNTSSTTHSGLSIPEPTLPAWSMYSSCMVLEGVTLSACLHHTTVMPGVTVWVPGDMPVILATSGPATNATSASTAGVGSTTDTSAVTPATASETSAMPTPASAASQTSPPHATSTSGAEHLEWATSLYVVVLIAIGIPSFLLGMIL